MCVILFSTSNALLSTSLSDLAGIGRASGRHRDECPGARQPAQRGQPAKHASAFDHVLRFRHRDVPFCSVAASRRPLTGRRLAVHILLYMQHGSAFFASVHGAAQPNGPFKVPRVFRRRRAPGVDPQGGGRPQRLLDDGHAEADGRRTGPGRQAPGPHVRRRGPDRRRIHRRGTLPQDPVRLRAAPCGQGRAGGRPGRRDDRAQRGDAGWRAQDPRRDSVRPMCDPPRLRHRSRTRLTRPAIREWQIGPGLHPGLQ